MVLFWDGIFIKFFSLFIFIKINSYLLILIRYRDCGIIPFTQDVDIAIWAHEYENKIKKHFLGNKIVRVWGTLGLVNDSYEFRLFNDKFTFDMFLVYKINDTHQWCGYQVKRYKFR